MVSFWGSGTPPPIPTGSTISSVQTWPCTPPETFVIVDTFFERITYPGDGGGLHVSARVIKEVSRCGFDRCRCAFFGGAIFLQDVINGSVVRDTCATNCVAVSGSFGRPWGTTMVFERIALFANYADRNAIAVDSV